MELPWPRDHDISGSTSPFEKIAGYKLRRLLGYGGFAHTFLAEKDGEEFALKILNELPHGAEAARFEREVEALRLEHPNLVRYRDSGLASYGGLIRPYIAMPYVPGVTLRDAIDSGAVPVERLRVIGAEVADGLAFLHRHNIAHRDLTPKNVFLPETDGVLIIDFGLARLQDRTSLTLKGQMLGTLAYCSPEQLRGETDLHTDLYGLGATLYHALAGRPPFVSDTLPALVAMINGESPEPPSAHNPLVPADLDELVLALLAKEPVQRPTSAEAVGDHLRAPVGAARAKPTPYDRDAPPLLAVRATTPSAGRAVLGAALTGAVPDLALAAITTPAPQRELTRAAGFDPRVAFAVDTRVETMASIVMSKAVRSRAYAPVDDTPYRHEDLRSPETARRVARGDIEAQADDGASVFRSPSFRFDSADDPWLKRDVRLLSDSLFARDAIDAGAPLYAMLRCGVDALADRGSRISIANRFSRGAPDGYWLEVYGMSAGSAPPAIAAVVDLLLLLQEQGVPAIAAMPGSLVEFAWSIGIGGAEVKLGRVGGTAGTTLQTPPAGLRPPRFELPSIFASFEPDEAAAVLAAGLLPESECGCPSCGLAADPTARVAAADDHDLACWLRLRDTLAVLGVEERIDRLRDRLGEAQGLVASTRGVLKDSRRRNLLRTLRNLVGTLDLLERSGTLAAMGSITHLR